jgi:zinc D-Ala-D-Ala carboxypeptidase
MTAPSRSAAPIRLAPVAAALAFLFALVALVARPALGPAGAARAMGPLPACRYDDILTTPRGYDDWSITLVDTILRLPRSYVPPDLVRVADLGVPGRGEVRAVLAEDLKAMSDAAAAANAAIGVQSPYRSYDEQKNVFDGWVRAYGYARALQVSARPGHSEHQLGVAIDFRSDPSDETLAVKWASTPAGAWMKAHAWEYGFVMSYPKGSMALTCYDYEPWHYRYVGRPLAALIHASGKTPREYLWAHFTTTIVPPPAVKTAAPAHTAAPTHSPVPSPTTAPSPSPTAVLATPTPVPTSTATASPSEAPLETGPLPTAAAPGDGDAVAGVQPVVLGGAAIAAGIVALGAWLARRRGRSGVGL